MQKIAIRQLCDCFPYPLTIRVDSAIEGVPGAGWPLIYLVHPRREILVGVIFLRHMKLFSSVVSVFEPSVRRTINKCIDGQVDSRTTHKLLSFRVENGILAPLCSWRIAIFRAKAILGPRRLGPI